MRVRKEAGVMCRRRRSSGEIWGSLVRLRDMELFCVLGNVLVSLCVYMEAMCKVGVRTRAGNLSVLVPT